MKNPQVFNQVEQLRKSNGNPQEYLNNLISKWDDKQIKGFINTAKTYGFTDEQLSNYGINAKTH